MLRLCVRPWDYESGAHFTSLSSSLTVRVNMVAGNFDLSDEQLESIAADIMEKNWHNRF